MWCNQIQPYELLNQSWSKPKLRHRAQNVLALINRFNKVMMSTPEDLTRAKCETVGDVLTRETGVAVGGALHPEKADRKAESKNHDEVSQHGAAPEVFQ